MSTVQNNLTEAYRLGAKGGPVSEDERQLFEAWMRGHCWAVGPRLESGEYAEMSTRICWAAWRDRAALGAFMSTGTPAKEREQIDVFEYRAWFYLETVHGDDLETVLDAAEERRQARNNWVDDGSYFDKFLNMLSEEFRDDAARVQQSCEYGSASVEISAESPDALQLGLDRCEKVVKRWLAKYRISDMKKD